MRIARRYIKGELGGERLELYHVISRVVDRRMVFGKREKDVFEKMMRQFEEFSGCQILTYCLMTNHFHIMLKVPRMPEGGVSDEEVWRRMGLIYSEDRMERFEREIELNREKGQLDRVQGLFDQMRVRMYDLSVFVKDLKQKFTRWFNSEHGRSGTLWEERFKSVVVDPRHGSLMAICGYIDLNPVRAGIVNEAHEYKWNGYGAAKRGYKVARNGIMAVIGVDEWNKADERYGGFIGQKTAGIRNSTQVSVSKEESQRILEEGGQVSNSELLRCRVKYFSNGVAMGGTGFIRKLGENLAEKEGLRISGPGGVLRTAEGVILNFLRRSREVGQQ